jgi:Mg2+/Co2+ transporter CorB
MISLLIWLVCVLLIAGAVLGVVRAVLATPAAATFQPYAGVIYALVVLIVVLLIVSLFYGGPTSVEWARPPRL